jgi:thiamine monophosphate kinase
MSVREFLISILQQAINGGEDYELLFTTMEDFDKIKETLISRSLDMTQERRNPFNYSSGYIL